MNRMSLTNQTAHIKMGILELFLETLRALVGVENIRALYEPS